LSFAENVTVNTAPVQVVNTKALTDAIKYKANSAVENVINQIFAQLNIPSFIKEPLEDFTKDLYCDLLLQLKIPSFSLWVDIPQSLTIPNPSGCGSTTIRFSRVFKEVFGNSRGLNGGVIETARRCLNGDLSACKKLAKEKGYTPEKVVKEKVSNNVMFVKGLAQEDIASKTPHQVEDEYVNRVKSLSQPTVDPTNPQGVVRNNAVEEARFGVEKEASSSTSELMVWGKEYSRNFPPQVQPYYNYVANKQLARRTVIESLRERIKQERLRLAKLAGEVRAYCNSEWDVKTIPPVRSTSSISNLIGELSQPIQLTEEVEANLLKPDPNDPILARLEKGLPTVRGCCCSCTCVWSAKNSINSHIETAKREIENTIERVGNMLADVISEEHYRTRQQINAGLQALESSLRKVLCMQAKIELQRETVQLLQLEVTVAQLETFYTFVNDKEMEQYRKKLKELLLQY
jgi:hypothetical protein